MFRTIWVHSGPFGCLTKLCGKRGELVQKFVSRSRIGIFRNERARSTPFDSKLTFWYVSYHLGASGLFGCLTKLCGKRRLVPRSRVGIFRNERVRSTPFDLKLTFWCVFVPFGCIQDRLVALRNSAQNWPN